MSLLVPTEAVSSFDANTSLSPREAGSYALKYIGVNDQEQLRRWPYERADLSKGENQ